jgi:hypothetical protein
LTRYTADAEPVVSVLLETILGIVLITIVINIYFALCPNVVAIGLATEIERDQVI